MNTIKCPTCGSEKISTEQMEETRQLTLGPEFSYTVPIHVCENCGEEGDFNGSGDASREKALEIARIELAGILINDIQSKGLKLSYIERAFELPQRTISSKWRIGISASGLALLRIISAMPWVAQIADSKFTNLAIAQEMAKVLVDSGATFETTAGGKNGIHIKITRASTLNTHINFDANQMLVSTGT